MGLGLLFGLTVVGFPLAVLTGADGLEAAERPATWDMSVADLRDIGLGQYRGDPVPVAELQAGGHQAATQGVIFVNFDGATLSVGYDDATQNITQIEELAGSFAPYGAGAKRDAVMQAVHADWAPYDVTVTQVRPGQGQYTMCMVGPTNPYGSGVLGIAPLDCNDAATHSNVVYAFHNENDSFSAATTATTIGQEVAHSYGLEHVDEPGDIMNPFNAGGDPSFRDECLPIVSSPQNGIVCGPQHQAQCGVTTQQNSHAELLALFGAAAPDTAPPSLQIMAPTDGATFDAGQDVDIVIEATDDTSVQEVRLYSNGVQMETALAEPFAWTIAEVHQGEYELYAEAIDSAGNSSLSDVITVYVGQAGPSGDTDSSGDDDGGSGDGEGGESTGGPDGAGFGTDGASDGGEPHGGAALPPGYGLDLNDSTVGCGCRTTSREGWAPLGIALLGLITIRRSRFDRSSRLW